MTNKHSIGVDAVIQYLENRSIPEEGRYFFADTITIFNEGRIPTRLLRRHWIITDGNGTLREVRGEGMVGEQPRLLSGECFRYTSAALIDTPVGTMRGEYQMLSFEGEFFAAPIPVFTLAVGSLN